MATGVVWSTLHKRKVSGSSRSANFLVLVPNLTVRDRVSGAPRGDGLDPAGERNLYDEFERPRRSTGTSSIPTCWSGTGRAVPVDAKGDDWIGEGDAPVEEGRFVPRSVLRAMRPRARQDPNAPIRRLLKGWRDVVVFNDEAHHVYGEKRTKRGEEPAYIRWSHILDRITKSARLAQVVDLSATPWYGSGSPKPEGTLFEWLVSDFSVYDAFESGLVKVVRLPDPKANVRSWAVGVTQPLADLIEVHGLPQIKIDPKQTPPPPDVSVKLVVGGRPEEVMTLDQFRVEWPVLRTAFQVAQDLHDAANPGGAGELRVGPTFEKLLDVAQRYLDGRTRTLDGADPAAWESTSGAGRSSTCWRRPSAALATVDLPPSPCSAIRNGSIQPAAPVSVDRPRWPPAGSATPIGRHVTPISRSSSPASSIGRRTWSAGSGTSGSGSR